MGDIEIARSVELHKITRVAEKIKIEFLKPRYITEDLTLENEKLMNDISEKISEYFVIVDNKKVIKNVSDNNG